MLHFLFDTYPGGLIVGATLGFGFRGLIRREAAKIVAEVERLKAKL